MNGTKIITEGLNNWKLRLILSATLCIMGLAALVSMLLGLFLELSTYDKSIVAIAIWMVGIPAYLIISGLSKITPKTIVNFLNDKIDGIDSNLEILLKPADELDAASRAKQEELIRLFTEKPLYKFLPDKPVKQAYFLMLISMISSFGIWFIS
ncbi:hypothetical protein [Balneola vulgaris]|jgi:hypothetical protein|uniref:hypothetical protein n=1 Tax=Balneola vulgaris TaxID=287535 RepID=UPI00036A8E87|nr:hypothetical protein [Balneola vulgaris]